MRKPFLSVSLNSRRYCRLFRSVLRSCRQWNQPPPRHARPSPLNQLPTTRVHHRPLTRPLSISPPAQVHETLKTLLPSTLMTNHNLRHSARRSRTRFLCRRIGSRALKHYNAAIKPAARKTRKKPVEPATNFQSSRYSNKNRRGLQAPEATIPTDPAEETPETAEARTPYLARYALPANELFARGTPRRQAAVQADVTRRSALEVRTPFD